MSMASLAHAMRLLLLSAYAAACILVPAESKPVGGAGDDCSGSYAGSQVLPTRHSLAIPALRTYAFCCPVPVPAVFSCEVHNKV